jgi:hypothetical protein
MCIAILMIKVVAPALSSSFRIKWHLSTLALSDVSLIGVGIWYDDSRTALTALPCTDVKSSHLQGFAVSLNIPRMVFADI